MMTSANREMKLIHHSTRERKLSTNFLGWYMYESPLESEHYRLPWFQSSSGENSSPSDASSPFTTSAFEEPSTEDLILEEIEELPDICEQNHLKEILQLTSRTRRTRQDQGIGQPLVKLLPETLRQDSQRLGEAGGEILWSVELEGDFDLNTLWWILLAIGSVGSCYIYPDLQRLLRIYVKNLQGQLVDAGCLEIVVVPTPQLTLFPKAFACGFMSGNTFLVMLASWQAGQQLIPKYFKIGPWLWPRESDTQTQFDYAVSAGLLLTPVFLWALQVGIERNGWLLLPPSSPSSNDSNLSWTNALFLGVLMAFSGALLPTRFSKIQRSSLGRTFLPWTWDAVAIKNAITRIVPLIFVTGWTLNLFQVTNALQITLGRISPVCALQFADVEWAQDFPILVRTIMLIALDIASRFLVEADLASPITTRDEDPKRKLNMYAFGFMVVLLGIFIATFRW